MPAFVTYLAPEGDEQSVIWLGYTFNDGEPVEVTDDYLISKARTNGCFDVEEVAKIVKKRPGRPRKVVAPVASPDPVETTDNAEVGA